MGRNVSTWGYVGCVVYVGYVLDVWVYVIYVGVM